MEKAIIFGASLTAVSYTHLDVYKRQLLHLELSRRDLKQDMATLK